MAAATHELPQFVASLSCDVLPGIVLASPYPAQARRDELASALQAQDIGALLGLTRAQETARPRVTASAR